MLKEHKNRLLKLMQDANVDLAYVESLEKDDVFQIQMRNSRIVFMLKQVPGSFDEFAINYTLYQPNFPLKISSEDFEDCKPYYNINGGIENEYKYWIEAVVKRYIYEKEMPDFWSQTRFYSSLTGGSISKDDLRQFSAEEKNQIQIAVKEFERLVNNTYSPTQEQADYINERLKYLADAVDRLNRFDWKGLAISIVTSIAINLSVDTEGGKHLFRLFQQAFEIVMRLLGH